VRYQSYSQSKDGWRMEKLKKWIPPACIPRKKDELDEFNGWVFHNHNEEEGTFTITLTKTKQHKTFGLTISGGFDKECSAHISAIKHEGLAHQAGYFCVNDLILTLCDNINVVQLNHEDIIKLVQNAGSSLKLKIKYTQSKSEREKLKWKTSLLPLKKINQQIEFNLQGGTSSDKLFQRPIIISTIYKDSNLERAGTLFNGDEIVSVNHQPIKDLTSKAVTNLCTKFPDDFLLEVKYQTHGGTCTFNSNGSYLVDVNLRCVKTPSGILLNVSFDLEYQGSIIIVSDITEASVADRCGYLSIGDLVLSINGISMDGMSLPQAQQIILNSPCLLQLEILKQHLNNLGGIENISLSNHVVDTASSSDRTNTYDSIDTKNIQNGFPAIVAARSTYSGSSRNNIHTLDTKSDTFNYLINKHKKYNTLPGKRSIPKQNKHGRKAVKQTPIGSMHSLASSIISSITMNTLKRCETIEFICHEKDLGIELSDGFSLDDGNYITIVNIQEGKAFAKSGPNVQVGDRIVSMNGMETDYISCVEFYESLDETTLPIKFLVEFNISDSIIPNEGTFTVKLPLLHQDIGITFKRPAPSDEEQYLRICDITKASSAYRLGILSCGDQLLSINKQCVSHIESTEAYNMMKDSTSPIEITFRKDDQVLGPTFSIELASKNESLGITMSGSEYPFEPIIVTGMSEDGLAYKSNAIQIGDMLLAINETSLRGKTLAESYDLLQNAGQKIKFLIKRQAKSEIIHTTAAAGVEKQGTEPQVWSWTGDDQVHVVNHNSSISMIFEKEDEISKSDLSDSLTSSSDVDILTYEKRQKVKSRRKSGTPNGSARQYSTSNSRANSRSNSRNSNKKSNRSLLEQEIISAATKSASSSPTLSRRMPLTLNLSSTGNQIPLSPLVTSTPYNDACSTGIVTSSPYNDGYNTGIASMFKAALYDEYASLKQKYSIDDTILSRSKSSASNENLISRSNFDLTDDIRVQRKSLGSIPSSPFFTRSSSVRNQQSSPKQSGRKSTNSNISAVNRSGNNSPSFTQRSNKKSSTPGLNSRDNSPLVGRKSVSTTPLVGQNLSNISMGRMGTTQLVLGSVHESFNVNNSPLIDKKQLFRAKSVDAESPRDEHPVIGIRRNLSYQPESYKNDLMLDFDPVKIRAGQNVVSQNVVPASRFQVNKVDPSIKNEEQQLVFQPFQVLPYAKQRTQSNESETDCSSSTELQKFFPIRMEKYRLPSLNEANKMVVSSFESHTANHKSSLQRNISMQTVVLTKSKMNDSFGFSVSDSLRETGVYVRSIEPGSLAERCGNMRRYDRILQVNGIYTRDMTCDQIVPLLQETRKSLELVIERKLAIENHV